MAVDVLELVAEVEGLLVGVVVLVLVELVVGDVVNVVVGLDVGVVRWHSANVPSTYDPTISLKSPTIDTHAESSPTTFMRPPAEHPSVPLLPPVGPVYSSNAALKASTVASQSGAASGLTYKSVGISDARLIQAVLPNVEVHAWCNVFNSIALRVQFEAEPVVRRCSPPKL